MSDPRSWFVYLLECADGSVYTGITTDVARRFSEHRAGTGARYTRSRVPVAIIGTLACTDRSEASRLEAAIKRLHARGKRQLCSLLASGDIPAALAILPRRAAQVVSAPGPADRAL